MSRSQRRNVTAALALVLLVAGIYLWYGSVNSGPPPPLPDVQREEKQIPRRAVNRVNAFPDLRTVRDTLDLYKDNDQAIDKMIADSVDKMGASVAAFAITLNPERLEALMQWPQSRLCCMLIAAFGATDDDRLRWAESLKRLIPDESMGAVIEASILLKSGKTAEALNAWNEVGKNWKLSSPEAEVLGYSTAAWQSMDFNAEQSIALSLRNTISKSISGLIESSMEAFWAEQVKLSSSSDDLVDAASLQLNLLEMYKTSRRGDATVEITSSRMEQNILNSLPQDAEFGTDGYTVADRLMDVRSESLSFSADMEKFRDLYAGASQEMIASYQRVYLLEREKAARDWLIRVNNK